MVAFQQEIQYDVVEHTTLLTSVSERAQRSRSDGPSEDEDPQTQMHHKWRRLSRQLSDRKAQLMEAIEATKPQVIFVVQKYVGNIRSLSLQVSGWSLDLYR